MTKPHEMQLRLVYSLLKPAARATALFGIPMRTVAELLRLALYELLVREGLPQTEIARRFGQSARNIQKLAQRTRGDFFRAEKQVGLGREIEDLVAAESPEASTLAARFPMFTPAEVEEALAELLGQERVAIDESGRLETGRRYMVLTSRDFHHRIDALNHFLDGATRAVIHRLVFDNRDTAVIKTITFTGRSGDVATFLRRLEGELRQEVASLEETALFEGSAEERFTLSLTLAPVADRKETP